ncbi:MAG: helix-turn-helix domain-containing protein [Candidatus Saccharimonadales bacterium]
MDFRDIGLSIRDKRVYEALLHNPQCSLRDVAAATGINRGSVFESVKDLIRTGLVTRINVGKRQRYRAKDPEVLHELIEEKRQQLFGTQMGLPTYIESLRGAGSDPSRFHFTSFYEGEEGTATILRDILKTCRLDNLSRYRVISSPRVSLYLYANFPHFTRERVALQLEVSVLRQGKSLGEDAEFATSRFLSAGHADTGCYTIVYGTKVAIITINEYNQTSGVIIDNNDFATVQRHLFDASWQLASIE